MLEGIKRVCINKTALSMFLRQVCSGNKFKYVFTFKHSVLKEVAQISKYLIALLKRLSTNISCSGPGNHKNTCITVSGRKKNFPETFVS